MIKFTRTTETCRLSQEEAEALPFDYGLVHALDAEPHPALSLDEIVKWTKEYNEENEGDGSAPFETDTARVALILVRLCEVGMAKVVME